jgi:ATP-dependent DNA helicase UvrD/PcrA
MCKNKLIIAAAGSGKTTFLVKEAIRVKDQNVLITTYTEANESEIRKNIIKESKGYIPDNITIQTWFSFLLQHGVRPFQSAMHPDLHDKKIGFYLTEKQSGFRYNSNQGYPVYWGENDFFKYYFTNSRKIYSDKISKFIVECNKRTKNAIVNRISKIFGHIYIDEVQDLAGWEFEILKLLFKSASTVTMVGDPRQVVYLTHHPTKHKNYRAGKIKEFIKDKCKDGICDIDENSLNKSHRNNHCICDFSSKLYPEYVSCEPCECDFCHDCSGIREGIFLVKKQDINKYCEEFSPTILRYSKAIHPEWNFGKCKGLTFENVMIFPTEKIITYLTNGDLNSIDTVRAKFYVALTRATHSVGIVFDYDESEYIDGLIKYNQNKDS